ncbi:short-chain fatty acid transporter, partial [Candidatus Gracilibacteria bacterium]
MFKKFTRVCVNLVQKYLPDPFLFAIILTIIVFISAMFATEQSAFKIAGHWYNGFWKLLKFSMQMALVLITGHTMANAPIIKKGLDKLAFAKTPTQAIILVTFVS